MKRTHGWIGILLIIVLNSCTNDRDDRPVEISASKLYLDYQVNADEESGLVTVKLEFHAGGRNGPGIEIPTPGKVELDGQALTAERSKLGGAYYEYSSAASDFEGKHAIHFNSGDGRYDTTAFEFATIMLRNQLPDSLHRSDLVFELEGLDSVDYVQVLLSDTSFYSRGIDRTDSVRQGRVLIGMEELDAVKNGPVQLEFYREAERRLRPTNGISGKIYFSYGIKRQFYLVD